jgi:hypothetical protein
MRTYEMAVSDVNSKIALYGKPVSFKWYAMASKPGTLEGLFTFESGKQASFQVPSEDTAYMGWVTELVNKANGSSTTQIEGSIDALAGKITETFSGVPIIGTVAKLGAFPLILFFGLIIGGIVYVFKKVSKRKSRKRRRVRRRR